MAKNYTSIFNQSTKVTKNMVCEILNLDISRPGLIFSEGEINKAYHLRALRFHPDKQMIWHPSLPIDICNILMEEISRARKYMLANKDNFPGTYTRNIFTMDFDDFDDCIDKLKNAMNLLNYYRNNEFILIWDLSQFSSKKNILLSIVFKILDEYRHFLKDIDTDSLNSFFIELKQDLKSNEQENIADIIDKHKQHLPKNFIENQYFVDFLVATRGKNEELKKLLTDQFIGKLQHIVRFWTNFIATAPRWKHIVCIYFISLIYTASSIPMYFYATKTITEVIWKQKGAIALTLSSLPILILTTALFPLNIAVHLGFQLVMIAMRAFFQIFKNSLGFLIAAICLVFSLFIDAISLSESVLFLFESVLNLTIRLAFNIAIEVLDGMIFLLTSQSMLSSFQSKFNLWLDSITNKQVSLITTGKIEELLNDDKQSKNSSCFDNKEDIWLKKLLDNLFVNINDDMVHENPGSSENSIKIQAYCA
jgi:hypothetical protein